MSSAASILGNLRLWFGEGFMSHSLFFVTISSKIWIALGLYRVPRVLGTQAAVRGVGNLLLSAYLIGDPWQEPPWILDVGCFCLDFFSFFPCPLIGTVRAEQGQAEVLVLIRGADVVRGALGISEITCRSS